MSKREYDSTVARIAGNIASGIANNNDLNFEHNRLTVAEYSVELARLIIAEVKRTEIPNV